MGLNLFLAGFPPKTPRPCMGEGLGSGAGGRSLSACCGIWFEEFVEGGQTFLSCLCCVTLGSSRVSSYTKWPEDRAYLLGRLTGARCTGEVLGLVLAVSTLAWLTFILSIRSACFFYLVHHLLMFAHVEVLDQTPNQSQVPASSWAAIRLLWRASGGLQTPVLSPARCDPTSPTPVLRVRTPISPDS